MILKKLKRTKFTKPKATMIAALVDYIFAKTDEESRDKLAYSGAKNFITTTLAAQKNEMISLASESIQSKMPVAHWIMSFQENEMPNHEQIDEAVDIFLERLGLEEHQALYALHGNTGNFHIHIADMRLERFTFSKIGNLEQPYPAYREMVKKRFPENMDESRIDAMIALWMRCTGYTYNEVGNAIYKQARTLREARERRDWKEYPQRMLNYAFGAAGDIDIAAFRPTPEKFLSFHQEAERLEAAQQAPRMR
jgi:hypothetical protein